MSQMANKQVGDKVRSTNINVEPNIVIEGTILEIGYNGIGEAIDAFVQQDDGIKAWWSL